MDEERRSEVSPESNSSDDESDDLPIEPTRRQKKRRRKTYIDFAKVYEIFPEQGTDILCQLSELEEVLPSGVHKLVPTASPVQIAAFLQLAKTTEGTQERGRQKSAEYRDKR